MFLGILGKKKVAIDKTVNASPDLYLHLTERNQLCQLHCSAERERERDLEESQEGTNETALRVRHKERRRTGDTIGPLSSREVNDERGGGGALVRTNESYCYKCLSSSVCRLCPTNYRNMKDVRRECRGRDTSSSHVCKLENLLL